MIQKWNNAEPHEAKLTSEMIQSFNPEKALLLKTKHTKTKHQKKKPTPKQNPHTLKIKLFQ